MGDPTDIIQFEGSLRVRGCQGYVVRGLVCGDPEVA